MFDEPPPAAATVAAASLRRRLRAILIGAVSILASQLTFASESARDQRLALVIGNGAYAQLPLKNPVNDARAMSNALRGLGFDVIVRENAGLATMVEAMREFLDRARSSQVRLVYFAGHGAQLQGRNYLIPTDAALRNEDELPQKTANVSDLVDKLGRFKTGVNVLILDACRDAAFPLLARTRNPLATIRTLPQGFAEAIRAPQGTVIAYSTAPGNVALDGPGNNSAYTRHLLTQMAEPGLPIEQLFKRVRDGVARDTDGRQVPWETSSLVGDFCFRPSSDGACPAVGGLATAVPRHGSLSSLAQR
jgi:uncharacterized caspase-like protein